MTNSQYAPGRPADSLPTLTEQLGRDSSVPQVYEFSNSRRTRRRTLSNIEVMERVTRFLRTGDASHLPSALRGEAEGIRSLASAAASVPGQPWPTGAAKTHPGPGASATEVIRALTGDDRADADSGLEDEAS
jgi:hypothetical protein